MVCSHCRGEVGLATGGIVTDGVPDSLDAMGRLSTEAETGGMTDGVPDSLDARLSTEAEESLQMRCFSGAGGGASMGGGL